jgi:hypothetical protein
MKAVIVIEEDWEKRRETCEWERSRPVVQLEVRLLIIK